MTTVTHDVDDHRLALALEEGGELLPIVRLALREQIAAAAARGGGVDEKKDAAATRAPSARGVDEIALKKFNPAVRGM